MLRILAIESSADETSISLLRASDAGVFVEKNLIASQIEMHREFGGIVPNLAGKFHAENIMPLLHEADISADSIDLIAVTAGPGLMPCLVVGVSSANALAFIWDKPLLPIHHIEGHIYANWISTSADEETHPAQSRGTPNGISNTVSQEKTLGSPASKSFKAPQFPALCLVVSGGHTQIMLMRDHLTYEILGQTLDDAVGEAYDKAARLLGLPYPGGPEIDARAHLYAQSHPDDTEAAALFTRPMLHSGDYNFSFSGLKTAVLYAVRDYQKDILLEKGLVAKSIGKTQYDSVDLPEEFTQRMCYAFQEAASDVLTTKTLKAAREYNVKSVLLAGGVSANKKLRAHLASEISTTYPIATFHVPELEYCLDNGAMIGTAAAYRWMQMSEADRDTYSEKFTPVSANPNLKIV